MKLIFFFAIRGIIAFVIGFLLASIMRTYFFNDLKKKSSKKREILISCLLGYILMLCIFMFMPNYLISKGGIDLSAQNFDFVGNFKDRAGSGYWGVNIFPLRTIKSYLKYSGFFHSFLNIVGNILIFVPLGFFIPTLYKRFQNFLKATLVFVLISLFIEFIQFFVGRSVDIDDMILNTLGGIIGYIIYRLNEKKLKKLSR